MATFNGLDRSLPVLTQVYQANAQDEEELLHLIHNMGRDAHSSYTEGLAFRVSQDESTGEFVKTMVPDEAGKKWLASIAMLVYLAQSVMLGLFERQALTRREWHDLYQAARFYSRKCGSFYLPYKMFFREAARRESPVKDEEWEEEFLVKETTSVDMDKESIEGAIVEALVKAVELTRIDRSSLARCMECENIFDSTRTGQRFCSRRCSSRAGERRRYKSRNTEASKIK